MTSSSSPVLRYALVLAAALVFLLQIAAAGWVYTSVRLQAARRAGVFPTAEDGMLSLVARGYAEPRDIEIVYAGTNSFDGSWPHVWYVIACVWGEKRADGSPVGKENRDYDSPGSFFLQTTEGWVHVPEGAFPEVMGFWMRLFGLAGPGSSQPSHEWRTAPRSGCVHQDS